MYTCPHVQERIGRLGEGGKFICGIDAIAKVKDCVVYSFGVNTESSFEAGESCELHSERGTALTENDFLCTELLDRAPNCKLWAYDYSVGKVRKCNRLPPSSILRFVLTY